MPVPPPGGRGDPDGETTELSHGVHGRHATRRGSSPGPVKPYRARCSRVPFADETASCRLRRARCHRPCVADRHSRASDGTRHLCCCATKAEGVADDAVGEQDRQRSGSSPASRWSRDPSPTPRRSIHKLTADSLRLALIGTPDRTQGYEATSWPTDKLNAGADASRWKCLTLRREHGRSVCRPSPQASRDAFDHGP